MKQFFRVSTVILAVFLSGAAHSEDKWPYSGTLVDGTEFKLNPRIVEKIKNRQPINYLYSYASSSSDDYSIQIINGYKNTIEKANSIYPIIANAIAPATAYDANLQISQIEAQFNSNQADCVSISVNGADAFTEITRQLMADGVPVFTNGAPTNGNEIGQFTQIPEKEGKLAADLVIEWIKSSKRDIKVFAVSGGNPTATWAQGRMIGFEERIKEAIPDAKFVTDHTNALSATFAEASRYSAFNAFFLGHPEVQFMLNADSGAGQANRVIEENGLKGKVFTIGWDPTDLQLDGVEKGIQVADLDQSWSDQGGFGALACATFLGEGKVLPNSQVLNVIGPNEVVDARAKLHKLISGQ